MLPRTHGCASGLSPGQFCLCTVMPWDATVPSGNSWSLAGSRRCLTFWDHKPGVAVHVLLCKSKLWSLPVKSWSPEGSGSSALCSACCFSVALGSPPSSALLPFFLSVGLAPAVSVGLALRVSMGPTPRVSVSPAVCPSMGRMEMSSPCCSSLHPERGVPRRGSQCRVPKAGFPMQGSQGWSPEEGFPRRGSQGGVPKAGFPRQGSQSQVPKARFPSRGSQG